MCIRNDEKPCVNIIVRLSEVRIHGVSFNQEDTASENEIGPADENEALQESLQH